MWSPDCVATRSRGCTVCWRTQSRLSLVPEQNSGVAQCWIIELARGDQASPLHEPFTFLSRLRSRHRGAGKSQSRASARSDRLGDETSFTNLVTQKLFECARATNYVALQALAEASPRNISSLNAFRLSGTAGYADTLPARVEIQSVTLRCVRSENI